MESINQIEEFKRSKSAKKIRFSNNDKNSKIRPATSHPIRVNKRLKYEKRFISYRSALKFNNKKHDSTIKNITEKTRVESARSNTISRSKLSSRNTQRSNYNKSNLLYLIKIVSYLKLVEIKEHLIKNKRPNTRNENRDKILKKNTFTIRSNFDSNVSAYKSAQANNGNI